MHPDVLARLLLDLAEHGDAHASVAVLAGAPQTACILFSRDVAAGAEYMRWETSVRLPGSGEPLQVEQQDWLRRLQFHLGEHGDSYRRRVLLPSDIGAARLIADLAAFVLEKAYGVRDRDQVTMRVRTDDVVSARAA